MIKYRKMDIALAGIINNIRVWYINHTIILKLLDSRLPTLT